MPEFPTIKIQGGPLDGAEHSAWYTPTSGTLGSMVPLSRVLRENRDAIGDAARKEAEDYLAAGGTHMFHGWIRFTHEAVAPNVFAYTGNARFVGSDIESPLIAQAWEPAHA